MKTSQLEQRFPSIETQTDVTFPVSNYQKVVLQIDTFITLTPDDVCGETQIEDTENDKLSQTYMCIQPNAWTRISIASHQFAIGPSRSGLT